jgi:2-dehydro-3-deoxyphosphogluconate aldolase/(4S)-4-hydroxy-2-oxoglutarate aldolase
MARFTRMQVLNAMYEISLVPVFYNPDLEVARNVALAVSRGGCKLLEFVNRGDHGFEVFSQLEMVLAREDPSMILGIGSIGEPYTAALFLNCGANFVVGPSFNPEVAKICNRRKVPYSPGCGSATEIALAEEMGSEIVKVFPGESVGGPKFVKSVMGPTPWTRIMPTGGVKPTKESVTEWINAGVAAMGMGSELITKELLAKKDWKGIEDNVRNTLMIIKEAKAGKK